MSDWPTLGSETVTTKKESSSNGEAKDKDNKKSSASAKTKAAEPAVELQQQHIQAEKVKDLKETTSVVSVAAAAVVEQTTVAAVVQPSQATAVVSAVLNEDAQQKSTSPVPEINHHQYASRSDKEKFVPKSIEDGNKRVSKPKWNRLDVEAKGTSSSHSSNVSSAAPPPHSRRRSPPRSTRRGGNDDYRGYPDDRRRNGSNRPAASSASNRGPRSGAGGNNGSTTAGPTNNSSSSTTTAAITNNASGVKPMRGPTSRRDNASQYITRSTRPSYTESKTPGLNGNPIIKSSDVVYDAKKPKPSLIGRPIIIDPAPLGTPIVTNVFGTYYFNGPTPFTLDTIGNIKESIKKQM